MAIQIGGTTVIDNSRNIQNVGIVTVGSGTSSIITNSNTGIVNVGSGITIDVKNGNINISGILTVSGFSVPVTLTSFEPAIGSTTVGVSSNIILNFSQMVGLGTTGFFEIKSGLNTTGGNLLEMFEVTSLNVRVQNNGRKLIINPTNDLGFSSSYYVTMSAGFVNNFSGINTVGTSQTYFFTTIPLNLGDNFGGGLLMCKSSPVRWVVAPSSTEVSRNWYSRGDANTLAQSCTGCTGWFVPSCTLAVNPGAVCRQYWDCYQSQYWTNTEAGALTAYKVNMDGEVAFVNFFDSKNYATPVRSFRCVTY